MTTLREAAQQALEALKSCSAVPHWPALQPTITALRDALAQEEPRNQCGETCERAKLCAVCARGLEEQEPMRPTFQEIQNAAANLRVMKEMFGDPAASCDIAEDGVCEVIDCCRKSPLILEALEIGYAAAQAEAAQYHAAMAGYRPERHAEMDADVAKIAAAITALKAMLAQEEPKESVRDLLIGAAAMAVAAERKGMYPGASEVADTILAQEEQKQKQKPVAWMTHGDNTLPLFHKTLAAALCWGACPTPLYTHPPRREWQSLSEEEIKSFCKANLILFGAYTAGLIRAIEAKLKEKNA